METLTEAAKDAARALLRRFRREDPTSLFWWQGPPINVGDWIGPYLFKAISGKEPVFRDPSNRTLGTVYLTVGSLARWFSENSIVWGSGIIFRDEDFWEPFRTLAVRGPLTRERFLELGYACPEVYGDPAVVLPEFYLPEVEPSGRIGVIPHYSNFAEAEATFADRPEVMVIDVRQEVEPFVREVMSCRLVVSSSLHGIIVAHAYGVPAGRGVFSELPGGDGVKFSDYTSGVSLDELPEPLDLRRASVQEMEAFAGRHPLPDLGPVRKRLLEVCPF